MKKNHNSKIDFVVMWVDGNDPAWQKEKNKYELNGKSDGSIYRYRDWDLLQYWFRGIEEFAPWVNNIYFVTWGHVPKWLNTKHSKLKIVNHKDFIPEEYLPTFSANTIENNLHRIKGLSENFVLFNDDVYLIKSTKPTDFFINNIPRDVAALNVHCPKKNNASLYLGINDASIINEHFDFRKSLMNNFTKWFNIKNGKAILRTISLFFCPRFPGFYQQHIANSYNKKTFEEVWSKEYDVLNDTCKHKFRTITDVNQWLFKEWQLASGNFLPRSIRFGESFYIDRDGIAIKSKILKYIEKQKGNIISINDGPMSDDDYSNLILDLKKTFNKIMPKKSSFEK